MSKRSISDMHVKRDVCYDCYRPSTTCMCRYIRPLQTKTQFVILMHPKEFRKTKNGTGHFTNLSLVNANLYVGDDFSQHEEVNNIINNPDNRCYVVYPSDTSINLNGTRLTHDEKNIVLFLIDATWPCSRSILRKSQNLDTLEKVSFTHNKVSDFQFKTQPKEYCLSTMESALCILELLNKNGDENLMQSSLDNFLAPFKKMVEYQMAHMA